MSKIFTNPNQLEEWIGAAECIECRHGIERALGYLIGEKFYYLVDTLRSARKIMRTIDEERKNPGFNPVRVTRYGNREVITDLDETYERERRIIIEVDSLLVKFVFLIGQAFSPYEIRKYLQSHPSLGAQGAHGYVATEEENESMVGNGALEHSIDREVEDALIFGDMLKYFRIDV